MKFSKSLSDLHVSVAEIGLSKYEGCFALPIGYPRVGTGAMP